MTFLEIIRSDLTNLPIEPYSTSFRELIRNKMDAFGQVIDDSDNLSDSIGGIAFTEEIFKRRSKAIRTAIIQAIDAYYEGKPHKAYEQLSLGMTEANISGYLDKQCELPMKSDLYRIRLADGNYPLSKKQLFHIPFEQRGKVRTQRYSIPGLPCLYLANSVYVAWEELKRPGFSEMQAVRISNNYQLQLLDLTTDIFSDNGHLTDNHAYGWQLLYKVMVWPLVAACSIKVKEINDPFKPEYIIPQLLLQWVNREKVQGIKYSSTHIDLSKNDHKGQFYNLVFPVKSYDMEKGHCPRLLSMFNSTQVISLQLRQFLTPYDRLPNQATISADVNRDIQHIEVIKGHTQPYHQTVFGTLEYSLKGVDLEIFD